MQKNNVIECIEQKKIAHGVNFIFPSTTLVELSGRSGFDFVTFDSEHGPFTIDMLDDLCRVADMSGLTPLARVPDISDSTILRFLDRGIMGITGPHITDGKRAKQLANACRYAPLGSRSFGSGRGAFFGGPPSGQEYMDNFNKNVIVIAQLEDIHVLDNIEDILSVDGIDFFASGAQDIAQSMGLAGQPNHPEVKKFEREIVDIVHKAGRKMAEDVMHSTRAVNMFLESSRKYLDSHKVH